MEIKEVTDNDNVRWQCVEAYSGIDGTENKHDSETVTVVCTPSGGAQTVRLELRHDWQSTLSDEQLIQKIEQEREIQHK